MSPPSGGRLGLRGLGRTVLFGLIVGCSVPAPTRATGQPEAAVVADRSAEQPGAIDAARRERSARRLQIMPARAGELRPVAALAAAAASSQALRNQAAYLQRQQQASAHRDAVLARNARMDAIEPPAAGLPVPAAAPASY